MPTMIPKSPPLAEEINWNRGFSAFPNGEPYPTDLMLEHSTPQLFPETTCDTIVICLHGWTASPYEALPIAHSVHEKEFAASVPCLPGHGIQSAKLAREIFPNIKFTDWINAVRKEIEIARQNYKKVYIYGQSMGGALALIMAEEHLVDACAVTAPCIDLGWKNNFLARVFGWTNIFEEKNEETIFFNECYPFKSVRSAQELRLLANLAKKQLSLIQCPVLECHSELDDTIKPKVAHLIAKKVSGPVEVQWYNKSGHTLPLDVEGETIVDEITKFFEKIRDGAFDP
ncbi:MAG: alpha/beta hydrolase [Promethearchaeota archaeon]